MVSDQVCNPYRRSVASPVSHLSDGGAELALEHLLQGLELVSGDVARLLQLLQQLDGSGNIWKEAEERGQRSASAQNVFHRVKPS